MSESSLIKLQVLGTPALLKRDSSTYFLLWILSINYFVEDLWTAVLKHQCAFSKHLIYRTSPVAASNSFRFPACNIIKKETPAKMFICEFCKIFKNIIRQKHLRMTASCVCLWILRSFSGHLFQRAPLENCLFHLQVAEFQPPRKKYFTSAF